METLKLIMKNELKDREAFFPFVKGTLGKWYADCKDRRSQAESEARLNKKSKVNIKSTFATVNAECQKDIIKNKNKKKSVERIKNLIFRQER